jgi:hypothetical protein
MSFRSELEEVLAARLAQFRRQMVEELQLVLRRELALASRADSNELVDAVQAAEMLGLPSAGSLRKAAARGHSPVPPVRVGRRLRWRRGDLVAFGVGGRARRGS